MFEFAPDYSSYSTPELLNALSTVDRERFAQRLAQIRTELAKRGVRYEETRVMVEGKPRYQVQLLHTVPSETLAKQWQEPSHAVEMDAGQQDVDLLSLCTSGLLFWALMWWFKGWKGDIHYSGLAITLMLLFVGFFLFTLGPKAWQRQDKVLAEHTQRMLLFYVALGLSALPFAMAQFHKLVLAEISHPKVMVLEIYNSTRSCQSRLVVETGDARVLEICQVPSHILDRVRPNEHIQIQYARSILGTHVESQRMVLVR